MEIEEEEERTQAPDFWNDPKIAETHLKKTKEKKRWVDEFNKAEESLNDLLVLEEFFNSDVLIWALI